MKEGSFARNDLPRGSSCCETMLRRFFQLGRLAALACIVSGTVRLAGANILLGAQPNRNMADERRITHAALAPDGVNIAYVAQDAAGFWLYLRQADGSEAGVYQIGGPGDAVLYFRWVGDTQVVYEVASRYGMEIRKVLRDEKKDVPLVSSGDLGATYAPTAGAAPVTIPRELRIAGLAPAQDALYVVAMSRWPGVPTEIYRVALAAGLRESVARESDALALLLDANGKPRIRKAAGLAIPVRVGIGRAARSANTDAAKGIVDVLGGSGDEQEVFELRTGEGLTAWTPLDRLWPKSLEFHEQRGHYFEPRSIPLAFGADPDVLYYASNVGRKTVAVYAMNVKTGQRADFAVESPDYDLAMPGDQFSDGPLVFDETRHLLGVHVPGERPTTVWYDDTFKKVQQMAEQRFGRRQVRIVGWDEQRTRFLLLVTGPNDPGRYFLFPPRAPAGMVEVLRRTSLRSEQIARASTFSFSTSEGTWLTGMVTQPLGSSSEPPAVIVRCPDLPAPAAQLGEFDAMAQSLAGLGCMVVDVNCRGTEGRGLAHLGGIGNGHDLRPIEDIRATLAWVAQRYPYDRRRVALMGSGFGGYLAVRALELFPTEFRCAVSVDGPADLVPWLEQREVVMDGGGVLRYADFASETLNLRRAFFGKDYEALGRISLFHEIANLRGATLLLETADYAQPETLGGEQWERQVRSAGREVKRMVVPRQSDPLGTALFRELSRFLDAQLKVPDGRASSKP